MQTKLLSDLFSTAVTERADAILRKCVHCGFCTATCPTYQLLGDELDGPRGRIYQVKQLLEGQETDDETLMHLDRCLTCRSCETTCPSGVNYSELIDIGRLHAERIHRRPVIERTVRRLLGGLLPYPLRNRPFFRLAGLMRPLLPSSLKEKTPRIRPSKPYRSQPAANAKTVLLLEGCVQSTLSPNTNAAAEALLQQLGYQVIREPQVSCCGAVNHHLTQTKQAHNFILSNLDKWRRLNEKTPLDAIVSTASGCGVMLKDYPAVLENMDVDGQPYRSVIDKICDVSELFSADLLRQNLPQFSPRQETVAYHAPCTLNHGQKLSTRLFNELSSLGYQLQQPLDAHLCCGSAGTYSLLQPALSRQLRTNKLDNLSAQNPRLIITANVGCEHHLGGATDTPVIHWVEMLADDLG